jgi:hypothetical protein
MALNEKSGKDEEYKVRVIALRTTSNIHTLIKVNVLLSVNGLLYQHSRIGGFDVSPATITPCCAFDKP